MRKVKKFSSGGDADFSPLEKDVLKRAIAAEDKAVNVDKLDQKKAFDKLKPYIKNAVQAQDKALGITKETPVELQKSFAEKLEKVTRGGAGGGGMPSDKMDKMKKMNYKSGGSVKSASARADGCAIRGKTRA